MQKSWNHRHTAVSSVNTLAISEDQQDLYIWGSNSSGLVPYTPKEIIFSKPHRLRLDVVFKDIIPIPRDYKIIDIALQDKLAYALLEVSLPPRLEEFLDNCQGILMRDHAWVMDLLLKTIKPDLELLFYFMSFDLKDTVAASNSGRTGRETADRARVEARTHGPNSRQQQDDYSKESHGALPEPFGGIQ